MKFFDKPTLDEINKHLISYVLSDCGEYLYMNYLDFSHVITVSDHKREYKSGELGIIIDKLKLSHNTTWSNYSPGSSQVEESDTFNVYTLINGVTICTVRSVGKEVVLNGLKFFENNDGLVYYGDDTDLAIKTIGGYGIGGKIHNADGTYILVLKDQ